MRVALIPAMEPLRATLPESAPEYYAFVQADLSRIDAEVYCVENALLTVDYSLPYQYKYSIADSEGHWIDKLNQQEEIVPNSAEQKIDERVGFIEDRFSGFNICHFLFDKMGRVTEFPDDSIDSYFLFLKHPYYSNVLSLLGLRQTPLIEQSDGIVTYRISKLYISTSTRRFRHPGLNFRPEVITLLEKLKMRSISAEQSAGSGKRIYVDRAGTSARDVVNRDVLNALLKQFDFEPVIFEEYSFKEQVNIVNQADILLGVHGAGLSNALFFGSENFRLLEILPPMCATSDYWKIANAFEFGYDAYIAHDLEFPHPDYSQWSHNATLNRRDILIDENDFRNFLIRNT